MTEKFGLEKMPGSWEMLGPHFARGALFLVAAELDLNEVATAMAADDTQKVKVWLESAFIRRPTDAEVAQWAAGPKDEFAYFIIVQPYVLIQLT